MFRGLIIISVCALILTGRISAQEVVIVREQKPKVSAAAPLATTQAESPLHIEKAVAVQTVKPPLPTVAMVMQPAKQPKIAPQLASQVESLKPSATSAVQAVSTRPEIATSPTRLRSDSASDEGLLQSVDFQGATAFTKLADGFDFPIGKPDAKGYYKARGFRSHGHLGEDWDGLGGGDTDLGDPIYCIGDGVVVFARDCKMGWGNVIIVRHAFREAGTIKNIDSFYGHLQRILVHHGQRVTRGQQIATMGNAHGLYDAHLHLEIRKNIEIGMSRAAFTRDFNNYYDPTQFILSHRNLRGGGANYRIAMNTFTRDKTIRWERKRYYSGYRGGSGGESAIALKKALVSQGTSTR